MKKALAGTLAALRILLAAMLLAGPGTGGAQLGQETASRLAPLATRAVAAAALAFAGLATEATLRPGRAAASTAAAPAFGTGWAWGNNANGQLGYPPTAGSATNTTPVSVEGAGATPTPFANGLAVAGGDFHALAIRSDLSLWAWGSDTYGQLGVGTPTPTPGYSAAPLQVAGPGGSGTLANVIAVAGGTGHSSAVTVSGGASTTYAWGINSLGQLGNGTACLPPTYCNAYAPAQVGGLPSNVVAVAAGGDTSLALTQDGKVYAWGANTYDQLGYVNSAQPNCNGVNACSSTPEQVGGIGPAGTVVVAIAESGSHSLALTKDGHVWAWGDDDYGQLGSTATSTCAGSACSLTPAEVRDPTGTSYLANIVAIAAGGNNCFGCSGWSLALTGAGQLYAWGGNTQGQLGQGGPTDTNAHGLPLPVTVGAAGTPGVSAIAAAGSGATSLATKADGTAYAWGANGSGQLGNGTTTQYTSPVQVLNPNPSATYLNGAALAVEGAADSLVVDSPFPPGAQCYMPGVVYCGAFLGDPVNPLSGSYAYTKVDLAIAGRGPSPTFSRTYNSGDSRVTTLGPGWTHGYDARLSFPSTGACAVVVVGPEGRSDCFALSGSAYVPAAGVSTALVKNGDGTYTATLKDQTAWAFTGDGRLSSIADRYGNASTLTYTFNTTFQVYELTGVGDPAGRGSLALAYDTCFGGRLCSVTDWQTGTPRVVSYAYDASGRLSTVTERDAGGNPLVTTYGYDGTTSRLASITDADSHTAIANTYDSLGRVVTQQDALANQTTFSYVPNGDGTTTTTITYPTNSYDSTHPVVTDTYNASGQLVTQVTQASSTAGETYTTSYLYDPATGNVSQVTDPLGNKTTYCYDTDYTGSAITGSLGNLTRRIDPPATTGANLPVTLYKYDAQNNLVETVPPKGVTTGATVGCGTNLASNVSALYATDNVYDASRVTLQSVVRRFTDPDLGQQTAITQFEYGDLANPGRVTRTIPPRGNVGASSLAGDRTVEAAADSPAAGTAKAFSYTAATTGAASLLDVYLDAGSAAGQVAIGLYADSGANSPGTLLAQTRVLTPRANAWNAAPIPETTVTAGVKYWIAVLGPAGLGTPTFRDVASGGTSQYSSQTNLTTLPATWSAGAGSASASLSAYAAPPDSTYATRFAYFGTGDPNKQSGMLQGTTDPLGDVTTYTYDPVGRRLSMVDPNGNVTGCSCAAAHTWSYTYDPQDRPLTVSAPAPTTGGTALTTTYAYDPVGNRLSVQDANGNVTRYLYDARDSLQEVDQSPTQADPNNDPNKIKTTYTYDNLGNLNRVTRNASDSNNARIADYLYDGLNRLRQETQYPTGLGGATLVTKYTYDGDSNRTKLVDPLTKTTTYTYDNLNRLTTIVYNDPNTHDVTYGYDADSNRASMADVTGTTTYAYDELDRVQAVTSPGSSVVGYRYDLDGNRRKLLYPGSPAPAVTYTFNPGSQLASLADWATPTAHTTSYQYTPDGSLKQMTNVDGTTATYSYDNALRLTQVFNQLGTTKIDLHAYTLDPVGNRTQVQEVLASPGLPNPLVPQNPEDWGLNASGQLGATSSVHCSGGSCSPYPLAVFGSGGQGTSLTGVKAIAAGANHTVALLFDGTVWAWGDNSLGQLGNNSTQASSSAPVEVHNTSGGCCLNGVAAIAAGSNHTLALKSDGSVVAWGANASGQLGNNSTTGNNYPVQVQNTTGIGGVSAGGATSLALKSDGSALYAWGKNDHGQLGIGSSDTSPHPTSTPVSGLTGLTVTGIAEGGAHSLAVATSGTNVGLVYAWGSNASGQLGNNNYPNDSSVPAQVFNVGGICCLAGVQAVAGGNQHSLALKPDGTVDAWGLNASGQLGNNGTAQQNVPVQVVGASGSGSLLGIAAIAAGHDHSVALKGKDGSVWAWGADTDGQLGDGSNQTEKAPVQVEGIGGTGTLAGQTAIAAGDFHTIAVATTRQVTTAYTYDKLYRLLSGGTPGNPTTYSYDPVGNRTAATLGPTTNAVSYSYDRADRITAAGGQTYTVDSDGNLTSYPNTTLVYDQANRLKTATISGTTTTYAYDGDGKRASKTVGANPAVSYVYDANRSLPVVLTDGALTYVWGRGLAYATDTSSSVQEVYHTDGLGSVRALTDASGTIVQTYQTDEFGVPYLTQGSYTQPFRFVGEQRDAESNFALLRARYYLPSLGRFLSRDRVFGSTTNPSSLNRFSYGQNNPVTMLDPSGLSVGAPQDPSQGSTRTTSMILQDSYDPALAGQNQNDTHSCSTSLLTYCGLWALLPGGGLVGGVLWDPCWLRPWTCDKDEGGGGAGRLSTRQIAERIAKGHAWESHWDELQWVTTKEDLPNFIEEVINSAKETGDTQRLKGGRSAYVQWETGTIVIVNPSTADYGTVMRPNNVEGVWASLR